MRELVNNIIEHKNTNDPKICFFLIEAIKQYNVESLEQLKKIEDDFFTPVEEEKMSDEKVLERLNDYLYDDEEDYNNCSLDEQKRIDELKKEFNESKDIDTKYIDIIKIFTILDWDMLLPYHTYKYILDDKLK